MSASFYPSLFSSVVERRATRATLAERVSTSLDTSGFVTEGPSNAR
jgi:hypothetical protein